MYFPCPKCVDLRHKQNSRSLSVRLTEGQYTAKCFHTDSCVWNTPVVLTSEQMEELDLAAAADIKDIEYFPIPDELIPPDTSQDNYYQYRDRNNERRLLVHRRNSPSGKKIFPMYYNGSELVYGLAPGLYLFGSQELARRPSSPVLVVEGEKSAMAAHRALSGAGVDMVVVTWPLGCSNILKGDWELLRGRDVTLWPDNDDPGKKAMNQIGRILQQWQ